MELAAIVDASGTDGLNLIKDGTLLFRGMDGGGVDIII